MRVAQKLEAGLGRDLGLFQMSAGSGYGLEGIARSGCG